MKRKKDKNNFDLPERGFEPQVFSNFPAHDLNSHVKSGAWELTNYDCESRVRKFNWEYLDVISLNYLL